ncbi:hypothetical protein M569_02538, partial [Genlisea aurea]
ISSGTEDEASPLDSAARDFTRLDLLFLMENKLETIPLNDNFAALEFASSSPGPGIPKSNLVPKGTDFDLTRSLGDSSTYSLILI